MNISATLNNNEIVNIVAINVNGHNIYISYVDDSANLKVSQEFLLNVGSTGTIIATSAGIIS
jgi:hypothetical protein